MATSCEKKVRPKAEEASRSGTAHSKPDKAMVKTRESRVKRRIVSLLFLNYFQGGFPGCLENFGLLTAIYRVPLLN
jgi:hypothetical protein